MSSYILNIENETVVDKVLWMLKHFKEDGVSLNELNTETIDIATTVQKAVNEVNLIKSGQLDAQPVEDLLNAI